jgi:hypothetical protein
MRCWAVAGPPGALGAVVEWNRWDKMHLQRPNINSGGFHAYDSLLAAAGVDWWDCLSLMASALLNGPRDPGGLG